MRSFPNWLVGMLVSLGLKYRCVVATEEKFDQGIEVFGQGLARIEFFRLVDSKTDNPNG